MPQCTQLPRMEEALLQMQRRQGETARDILSNMLPMPDRDRCPARRRLCPPKILDHDLGAAHERRCFSQPSAPSAHAPPVRWCFRRSVSTCRGRVGPSSISTRHVPCSSRTCGFPCTAGRWVGRGWLGDLSALPPCLAVNVAHNSLQAAGAGLERLVGLGRNVRLQRCQVPLDPAHPCTVQASGNAACMSQACRCLSAWCSHLQGLVMSVTLWRQRAACIPAPLHCPGIAVGSLLVFLLGSSCHRLGISKHLAGRLVVYFDTLGHLRTQWREYALHGCR